MEIIAAAKKTKVILYENDDCSGDQLQFKVSNSGEQHCNYCLDTCHERYTTNPNKDAHDKRPKSIKIFDDDNIGFLATTYNTCSGSFGYNDPGFQNSYITGGKCVKLPWHAAHFIFWAPSPANPDEYVSLQDMDGSDTLEVGVFDDTLKTGHWGFGPSEGFTDAQGMSFYTYIFNLFDPKVPRPRAGTFQAGTGGTWLKPTWKEPFVPGKSGCFCDPTSGKFDLGGKDTCPAQDKTTCTNGCCNHGCTGLYQTLEGGTGYWLKTLPTSAVKWRLNGCTGRLSGVKSCTAFPQSFVCFRMLHCLCWQPPMDLGLY